jgi:hypothetical protein
MKVRIFVSGSAALFAAWLGLTFVRDVPRENYPELGRPVPVSAKIELDEPELTEGVAVAESAVAMD